MTRLTVNSHTIRSNAKRGTAQPPIAVRSGNRVQYGSRVNILGADGTPVATVVYQPDKPLSCGARVWVEAPYGTQIEQEESTDGTA